MNEQKKPEAVGAVWINVEEGVMLASILFDALNSTPVSGLDRLQVQSGIATKREIISKLLERTRNATHDALKGASF